MKITFSKVLYHSGYAPYVLNKKIDGKRDLFNTLKELKQYFGITELNVIGEEFAISSTGKKHIYKLYEFELKEIDELTNNN